jgi:hypothetical protein
MPTTSPDWFRMISEFQPAWTRGATIPFIFGAVRNPMGEPPPSPG